MKSKKLDRLPEGFRRKSVGKEVKEEIIKEVIESCEKHIKKYGFRRMTLADLRKKITAK